MKVVIMAGGKGTRVSSITENIPKPMLKIGEKPVLEHELICLRKQGFTDILITIGHLGDCIKEYFKTGEKLGIRIKYFEEKEPLGTAGALYYLKEELKEDFFLLNGDVLMDINFRRMLDYHKKNCADATLLTHPNGHPYDSALIITDEKGRIIEWLNKEEKRSIYKNRVNAGIHILSPRILEKIQKPGKIDLDRELLKPFVALGKLYAYDSPEYIRDMGTPERYQEVCSDYQRGIVQAKNLMNKQKAVFLDRDGTLNEEIGFLANPEQIKLLEGVTEALRIIHANGYLAIVVTNQPVIARGDCTIEELEMIHNKLETELGKEGAYFDDLFYCPHHPERGFLGERIEYKKDCTCRKPKPGLLLEAAQKYNIDLAKSYMVGDSERDVIAGMAAGCISVYIGNKELSDQKLEYKRFKSLLDFVNVVIKEESTKESKIWL